MLRKTTTETQRDTEVASAGLGLLSILSLAPPALNTNAPATEFSADRARDYLKAIAVKPHPIGSPEHAAVRDYIFNELVKLGLQPQVQKTIAVKYPLGPCISRGNCREYRRET